MSMNRKRLEELYLRHLNGEQPGETEMNEVLAWIAKDERNKNYLERLYIATKAKTLSEQLKSVDVDKNWTRFRDTMARKTLKGADNSFTRNTRLTLLRIAAATIFLAATAAIFYFV